MSEKLYKEDGFHYITNLDFSSVCIETMRERNADLDEMDYVEMDLTQPLDILDSESFTVIIDKATFDCVACSDHYGVKTKTMLDNIHRILAPGGSYICVSHGRPETRLAQMQ
jgi:ubiquinone/menaquinone biosynthesis C-methylase UbiE